MYGPGPRAEAAAVKAAQNLVQSFRNQNGEINCLEITETDPRDNWQVFVYFFVKGGTIGCIRRAGDYAPEAFRAINAALSEKYDESSYRPANCAARLASKIGASEMQTVMAAGLAGGIGLSGGACGALGAAIWLIGIKGREQGLSGRIIKSWINDTVESFLKSTNFAFECAEIVGRRFENVDDCASHASDRGCAEIIDTLAANLPDQIS